jgi:hypothetical protein
MLFYALRLTCGVCHGTFVVGGSRASDLTSWRGHLVECKHCEATIVAGTGEVVALTAPRTEATEAILREAFDPSPRRRTITRL